MEYTSLFLNFRLEQSETSANGRRDIRLGMAYNQMSVAYMMNRDYETAVGALEKAFEVHKDLENSTPIMVTLPAANMGLARWFLKRYDDAYQVLIDILGEREKVFGINDNESFKLVLLSTFELLTLMFY
jgi:tetratricopeptide (TPR) repeat protein